MSKDKSQEKAEENGEKKEKHVHVPRTASEQQRYKLAKLLKNPEKPVFIPEKREEKLPRVFNPPEFVRNIWGSSAGVGSGDFHVYRGMRRREYARQKFLDQKQELDELDEEFQKRLAQHKAEAESKTAKKRAKRLKKKAKQKGKKKSGANKANNASEGNDSDESEEEDEEEGNMKQDQEGEGVTQETSDGIRAVNVDKRENNATASSTNT